MHCLLESQFRRNLQESCYDSASKSAPHVYPQSSPQGISDRDKCVQFRQRVPMPEEYPVCLFHPEFICW
jgi:hypothetical protein